ncbi:uncharacterized protein KGF55_001508 [Candida pseudojiufengensis]|uniref:uncharacterized protein n=1 Tax=Candida pseudojiufengensis TaxID=497109 RepID=UPI00222454C7|nr:uncharacterized protein KGF55_001508 [Candida pseudojiufengensis]KAI5965288.1 hypothetical protein KGF55_001508 [Candida pseudojiufengensis]
MHQQFTDPSIWDKDEYFTSTRGIIDLIFTLYDGPDKGTGIYVIVNTGKNIMGQKLPQTLINNLVGNQNNLLGEYPQQSDFAPSILFSILFGLITIIYCIIFIINTYRGHYFLLTLFWGFCTLMRCMSFIYRAVWSQNITNARLGIADEILLVIPSVLLISANLILAQRLFTWRHPVGGTRKLFWIFMLSLYGFVAVLLTIAIVASAIPYDHLLGVPKYELYKNLNKWICVMLIAYTLTAIALIILSFWLPTKKDEKRYTYQPWWIESFSPFYFVKKGAAQRAELTFMKRNSNHRHATRVIAATHHHYNMVEGLTNQRGDLKHNISLLIVSITTICVFIAAILRCIVVFQARRQNVTGPASNPVAMYFSWGVFEFTLHLAQIIGRADLRFYRPDILPAQVRAIVTAEQSRVVTPNHSDDEETGSEEETDDGEYDYEDDDDDYDNDDGFVYNSTSSKENYNDENDTDDDLFFGPISDNQNKEKLNSLSTNDSYNFNTNQHTYTNTPKYGFNEKQMDLEDEFKF